MKRLFSISLIFSALFFGCDNECKELDWTKVNLNNGCYDFMVFDTLNVNAFENCYVTVEVVRDEVKLRGKFKSFEILNNEYITSEITQFNKSGNCFCKDYSQPDLEILNLWEVKSGTVEIRVVHEKNECNNEYVVDVILKNVLYEDSQGNKILIKDKEFMNVLVGFTVP